MAVDLGVERAPGGLKVISLGLISQRTFIRTTTFSVGEISQPASQHEVAQRRV